MSTRNVEDIYPLSPVQQGMLFHAVTAPGSDVYQTQIRYRIAGDLDPETFREAWRRAVARHPILRTAFVWEELEKPLQVVHREVEVPFEFEDWSAVPAGEQEARIQAFVESEREIGFDLARAPLMRIHLIRRGDGDHEMVWSHHHLLLDGWSLPLVLSDVLTLYRALRQDRRPLLPRPRPFRDYVAWIQQQDLEAARDYWQRTLAGFHSITEVAVAPPAAAPTGHFQRELHLELGTEAAEALQSFARGHRLTPNTVTLGAWALLLSRYSGDDDVVFGTAVAGRPPQLEGSEKMVGMFINTLPTRVRTARGRAVLPWLREIQEQQLEQRLYEHSPLAEVQKWSPLGAGKPLFETLFVFENYPSASPAGSAGEEGHLELVAARSVERTNYPITASAAITRRGLELLLAWDRERFDDGAMERLAHHWQRLLEALVAAGGDAGAITLDSLPVVGDDEARELLDGYAAPPAPAFRPLHRLFEEAAGRDPEAEALVFDGGSWSYGELERRSRQLARHLAGLGVDAETRVALVAERSPEMVAALLAVLRAGGAYVPIDPAYPAERKGFLLADSGARVAVGQGRHLDALPADEERIDVALDRDALEPTGDVPLGGDRVEPHRLAYVLYTSGSTGRPKGVMISHGAIAAYVQGAAAHYAVEAGDRVLQFASISFDTSAEEIYPTLVAGATLALRTDAMLETPADFWRQCREWSITVLNFPTAYWQALAADLERHALPPRLRLVIIGGEQALAGALERWRDHAPGVRMVNSYGPTEATIVSTTHEADAGVAGKAVPIGRPVAGTRVQVVDRGGLLAPTGVTGELTIAGSGLARGYLGKPARTAELFVPDPFGEEAGGRRYLSGDLVRLVRLGGDPTAALGFVGRRDHQVKVRGFRIELGEIEATLDRHPAVREAAVTVHREGESQRLVAHVVAAGDGADAAGLRGFCAERLPGHMVPALFVFHDALPLTPSGKVDRRALPAPERETPAPAAGDGAPTNDVEKTLAEIWAQVLGLERVGIHDDFFALGGDSIISLQIVARAHEAGLRFNVRQLFKYPTLAELGPHVGTARAAEGDQGPVRGPVPLTPIQHWFFELDLPNPDHYCHAVVLECAERIDPDALEAALRALVLHHDALRLRFVRLGRFWRQVNAGGEEATLLRTLEVSDEAAAEVAATEVHRTLHLAEGPLLQAALLRRGEAGEELLLSVHHLVVDGVSWRLLLADLDAAYAQARDGVEIRLPAKTTSFKAWAEALEELVDSGDLDAELEYWSAVCAQEPPTLPRDRDGDRDGAGTGSQGSVRYLSRRLGAEATARWLEQAVGRYAARADELLLAATATALCRWLGGDRVRLDLEWHGRDLPDETIDVSRTVGWLTALFPVVVDFAGADSMAERVRRVKETVRGVPGGGVGYGVLRYLGEEEALAEHDSEVAFNYLGRLGQPSDERGSFRLRRGSLGRVTADDGRRSHLLEINGFVLDGELELRLSYSDEVHDEATVAALAEDVLAHLDTLLGGEETAGRALGPADFPLAELDAETFDRLLAEHPGLEDVYPLSPTQEGMLFHALYQPQSTAYFEQLVLTFEGDLDRRAWRGAWERLVERHPILRTAFPWQDLDRPLQVVESTVELDWREVDWREIDGREIDGRDPGGEAAGAELERLLAEDRAAGFELDRAPLMRWLLIERGAGVYDFVWSHHHLLLDGWSSSILLSELFTLYRALRDGRPVTLPSVRPYADYVAWLAGQSLEEAESYWRERLAGFEAPTPLALDREPDPDREEAFGETSLHLDAAATEALRAFARTRRVTLSNLTQGAWAVVLSRYSGERDVVFGAVVSGRPPELDGVESMVGLFINVLPVRVPLPRGGHLGPWLEALRDQQLEMARFEYSPLAKVQGWSEVPSEVGLFESFLVFENYPVGAAVSSQTGLSFERVRSIESTTYPLTVGVLPSETLELKALFDLRRFDPATCDRILGHWRTVLEAMAGDPRGGDRPLDDLPILTAGERRQLVVELNRTTADFDRRVTLSGSFRACAEAHPDAEALVHGERRWSYAELARRVERLAWRLRRLGVGPEDRVAVCTTPSSEMIVAVLATLEAGAAYVPLDPAAPPKRLGFLLRDSGAELVLTDSAVLEALPEDAPERLVLDADWARIEEGEPVEGPTADPEGLAYLIYTSGSTGVPKGVAVSHRAVINLVTAVAELYGMAPGVRTYYWVPLFFDASVEEIFPTLLHGGTLVIPPVPPARLVGRELSELFDREQIHVFHGSPTFWHQWTLDLAADGRRPPSSLRLVLVGGQAPTLEQLRAFSATGPGEGLFVNAYGPTEATVTATYFATPWDEETTAALDVLPIGGPLANKSLYVLSEGLVPLPAGAPGHLYLGGEGLARGYHGRPGRTAESFLPDPFTDQPGERLYATGDRVTFDAAGRVVFLGRGDDQVKIRGFRIELGEVRSVLARHPDVAECEVLALPGPDGQQRLVAYLGGDETLDADAVRELEAFLRERLPDYMVPAVFVPLAALPRLANGKVDREALPDPDGRGVGSEPTFEEPRNATERDLADIWCQVLKLERVSRHDSFFTVGGNSLTIIQLHGRIRRQLGDELSLMDLFQFPTVAAQARQLEARREADASGTGTESGTEDETLDRRRDRGARRRQRMTQQRRRRS